VIGLKISLRMAYYLVDFYHLCDYLSAVPEAWKVRDQAAEASAAPKRSVWQLLGRGVATMSVIMALFLLLATVVVAPIGHSMARARRIHDAIRVGMTLPEVLEASRDCDLWGASSDAGIEKAVTRSTISRRTATLL
jgi:hypothetical protein